MSSGWRILSECSFEDKSGGEKGKVRMSALGINVPDSTGVELLLKSAYSLL